LPVRENDAGEAGASIRIIAVEHADPDLRGSAVICPIIGLLHQRVAYPITIPSHRRAASPSHIC
jgi:hypothetical protein